MTWMLWIVVGFHLLGIVATISQTGKKREPTTPAVVAVSTLISLALIALVIFGGIIPNGAA